MELLHLYQLICFFLLLNTTNSQSISVPYTEFCGRPPRWTGSRAFVIGAENEELRVVQPEDKMALGAPNSSFPSTSGEKMEPMSSEVHDWRAKGKTNKL